MGKRSQGPEDLSPNQLAQTNLQYPPLVEARLSVDVRNKGNWANPGGSADIIMAISGLI